MSGEPATGVIFWRIGGASTADAIVTVDDEESGGLARIAGAGGGAGTGSSGGGAGGGPSGAGMRAAKAGACGTVGAVVSSKESSGLRWCFALFVAYASGSSSKPASR
jgi:hypothetical protein